ncbi:hypothetical protein OA410_03900, partial [Paracoccaceae bacterium]|nr:hypothetical protein [Paracoccaceae bacterium]
LGIFGHGFTYSAHPMSAAVALRTLEIYEEKKIVEHVRNMEKSFIERISFFKTIFHLDTFKCNPCP